MHKSFGLQTALNAIVTDAALTVTSGSYDQTKTNLFNRVAARMYAGSLLSGIGSASPNFLSTQDLSGTPNPVAHGYALEPASGTTIRILVSLTPAAASLPIAYFTYNYMTDAWAYVGKLTMTLNTATVHTVRWLALDDNSGGTTGWSIHVLTTNATVANGGYFVALNIAAADFTVGGGTTIASATTGDTLASKKVFWFNETGGTNLLQIGVGAAIDQATKTIYLAQATTSTIFYKFTYNTTISTVSVAGMTTDPFNFKTGTNAGFGTLLQTNAIKLAIPKSSQSPSLIGQKCMYLASATAGFHFLLSDLSNGSTTVPSVVTWNKLGTGTDYTAITWVQSMWSNTLDCEFTYSASGIWMMKRSINNDPNLRIFGSNDPIYDEVAGTKFPSDFSNLALAGCFTVSGVLFANSTTAGQRGIHAFNAAADQYFAKIYTGVVGPSFIVTPVVTVNCAKAIAFAMVSELRIGGIPGAVQYKTSSFGTWQSGWSDAPSNNDWSTVGGMANVAQVQLRILPNIVNDYNTTMQLINEIILVHQGKYEVSDKWLASIDLTSRQGESPVKITLKQIEAYGSVRTITINLYDSTGSLVGSFNTSAHYAQFKKSTNSGVSFTAMTGANDYTDSGAGTTQIEFDWLAPVAGQISFGVTD